MHELFPSLKPVDSRKRGDIYNQDGKTQLEVAGHGQDFWREPGTQTGN